MSLIASPGRKHKTPRPEDSYQASKTHPFSPSTVDASRHRNLPGLLGAVRLRKSRKKKGKREKEKKEGKTKRDRDVKGKKD